MQVTGLGHSSFIVEMAPPRGGEPVRILVDPWLSDHVIGDLLGRFPRLRFGVPDLGRIDAVFLSHAHTDHLDPYTLARLFGEWSPKPVLLLPESLRFLEALLEEHLEGAEIVFLRDREPVPFRGLTVRAFFNPEVRPSNEDDVMVLVVESEREVLLSEADAVLPFYDEETRAWITEVLCADERETIVFLTTKNEIDATMASISAMDLAGRRRRVEESVENAWEEIAGIFAPFEEGGPDLWQDERLVRLVAGQGIGFPQDVRSEWNRVLFPIRIADRVRMEREVAAQFECRAAIEELVPGEAHRLDGGRLVSRRRPEGLRLLDREDDRRFDPELELFEDFPEAPLRDERRETEAQREAIARALNERFLPHLIGARDPPVEHLLAAGGGEYRIRVRYGNVEDHRDRDWLLTFATLRFEEGPASEEAPDEHYWANDLDDVLRGRADEFSTFCRRPLPARALRFWRCLGLPYLNGDLVERKLRFHFERARRGERLEDWVLGFWTRGTLKA